MEHVVYPVAWISSACAAIAGVYFTGSPWCVLIMILPAIVTAGEEKDNE